MAASLVPSPSREAVGRAVDSLLKWMRAQAKQRKAQLLEYDDLLYLVLTVKRIPPTGRTNPYRIPLPHPLHTFADDAATTLTSICLLVDDRPNSPFTPSAARARIMSDSLPIADIIGLSDLRSDYRAFEARRRLCDSHDLFFADRRIIPLLPRLLGKHFFKKKKIPLPVELSRKGWPEQIRQYCISTLLYLRTGTCSGLKVGRVSQDRDNIVDNVMAVIEGAVEYVPRKWANVRSLHIKSVDSLALPIFQAVPELGFKIDVGSQKKPQEEETVDGEVLQMEEEVEKDEAKMKSLEGPLNNNNNKKKKKKGRIHEVQYMDFNPEYGSEDDNVCVPEDDSGEVKESDELAPEKSRKKEKVDVKVKKAKDKRGKRDDNLTKAGEEENGTNELDMGDIMMMEKKRKKKQKVGSESLKDKDGLRLSNGAATTADGLKKKIKAKKQEDKDPKKVKE